MRKHIICYLRCTNHFYRFWIWITTPVSIDTLSPRQNGHHLSHNLQIHSLYENCCSLIKILLKFIPIDNKSPAGHVIIWSLMGGKPLSKTMMDQFAKFYMFQCVILVSDDCLTHWGRVTHMCLGNLTIIGSDNGLAPNHYLNQCWNIVNRTYRNKLKWHFDRNWYIFILENGSRFLGLSMFGIAASGNLLTPLMRKAITLTDCGDGCIYFGFVLISIFRCIL